MKNVNKIFTPTSQYIDCSSSKINYNSFVERFQVNLWQLWYAIISSRRKKKTEIHVYFTMMEYPRDTMKLNDRTFKYLISIFTCLLVKNIFFWRKCVSSVCFFSVVFCSPLNEKKVYWIYGFYFLCLCISQYTQTYSYSDNIWTRNHTQTNQVTFKIYAHIVIWNKI